MQVVEAYLGFNLELIVKQRRQVEGGVHRGFLHMSTTPGDIEKTEKYYALRDKPQFLWW